MPESNCGTTENVASKAVFVSKLAPSYDAFRIPALLNVPPHPEGHHGEVLLAFAEGRKDSSLDWGNIDLVLRRSLDGGQSFEGLQVVASGVDVGLPYGATVGNPAPVFERDRHTVILLLTVNHRGDNEAAIWSRKSHASRDVFVMRSSDAGKSWSLPRNITSSVKPPSWTWYATGPGAGIQMKNGRLVVPCDHVDTTRNGYVQLASHVIFSDDRGDTWHTGGAASAFTNECTVAELPTGELLLNMRDFGGGGVRIQQVSPNGGESWTEPRAVRELVEPLTHGCQGHMISVNGSDQGLPRGLFFSNPASNARQNLAVRWSKDGGASWPCSIVVNRGFSAYSSLQPLGLPTMPTHLGVLFECGESQPYERIDLAILDHAHFGVDFVNAANPNLVSTLILKSLILLLLMALTN